MGFSMAIDAKRNDGKPVLCGVAKMVMVMERLGTAMSTKQGSWVRECSAQNTLPNGSAGTHLVAVLDSVSFPVFGTLGFAPSRPTIFPVGGIKNFAYLWMVRNIQSLFFSSTRLAPIFMAIGARFMGGEKIKRFRFAAFDASFCVHYDIVRHLPDLSM